MRDKALVARGEGFPMRGEAFVARGKSFLTRSKASDEGGESSKWGEYGLKTGHLSGILGPKRDILPGLGGRSRLIPHWI